MNKSAAKPAKYIYSTGFEHQALDFWKHDRGVFCTFENNALRNSAKQVSQECGHRWS
jgi:hypothetical protein